MCPVSVCSSGELLRKGDASRIQALRSGFVELHRVIGCNGGPERARAAWIELQGARRGWLDGGRRAAVYRARSTISHRQSAGETTVLN